MSSDTVSSLSISSETEEQVGNKILEDKLIQAIEEGQKRLGSTTNVVSLIKELENVRGIDRPAVSEVIEGRWRLIHTTNESTSSPIQRTAVDASKYSIYQDILVRPSDDVLIVSQVVSFNKNTELRVDALASTSKFPLPELTRRKKSGKIFGMNVLGVSMVGEEAEPIKDRPDSRINFVFDEGNFEFGGFKIPYPVPFRLPIMRDNVKGWIDVTYLSERVRISRGNKGTTFVLLKEKN